MDSAMSDIDLVAKSAFDSRVAPAQACQSGVDDNSRKRYLYHLLSVPRVTFNPAVEDRSIAISVRKKYMAVPSLLTGPLMQPHNLYDYGCNNKL